MCYQLIQISACVNAGKNERTSLFAYTHVSLPLVRKRASVVCLRRIRLQFRIRTKVDISLSAFKH